MKDDDEKKKEETPLTPVGDGAEDIALTEPEEKEESSEETEEKASGSEDDERVGHGEEADEDREKIRERRRQERRERRERDARLRREVAFLRARNEAVERQLSETIRRQEQHENLTLDQRISQIESQIAEANRIHSRAVIGKDEEIAAEALSVKDQLTRERDRLTAAKQTRQTRTEGGTTPGKPEVDPGVFENARSWVERNSWFDPKLQDERSVVVRFLESRITADTGLRPNDLEYWRELDRRVAKRFPDLKRGRERSEDDDFDDGEDFDRELDKGRSASKKKPSGPRFSVGGRTRTLKPNEVFLSAQRRQAMEEMGAWDDPVLKERYLRAYQKYDEEAEKNSRTR